MDVPRPTSSKPLIRRFWYVPLLLAIPVSAHQYYTWLAEAAYSIDVSTVRLATVQQGEFRVTVHGPGVLAPREVRWISTNVAGRVDRIFARPGTQVEEGEIVMQLANPELLQRVDEARWELSALEANIRVQEATLESRVLDQQMIELEARLRYDRSRLRLDAETTLIEQGKPGAISHVDYEQIRLEAEQLKQTWDIQKQRSEALQKNAIAQAEADQAELRKTQKAVERMRRQVESLTVVADTQGVVQEVLVDAGQQVALGAALARIAPQDDLIATIDIPELQIADVRLGQRVVIDTRNNEIVGHVSRINPSVVDGVVQVDVEFDEPLPTDARPDLSVDGAIHVAEVDDALFVKRPLYAPSHSRGTVYRLTPDKQLAERVPIAYGYGAAEQIQVVEGLAAGEIIIVSDSGEWETFEKIRLNQE